MYWMVSDLTKNIYNHIYNAHFYICTCCFCRTSEEEFPVQIYILYFHFDLVKYTSYTISAWNLGILFSLLVIIWEGCFRGFGNWRLKVGQGERPWWLNAAIFAQFSPLLNWCLGSVSAQFRERWLRVCLEKTHPCSTFPWEIAFVPVPMHITKLFFSVQ